MLASCCILFYLAINAELSQNLLVNGGFEQVADASPQAWQLFVSPQEGAFGRLEEEGCSGMRSVMLFNPMPYAREPFNNWSQNVPAPQGGKVLRLSGSIKTDDAVEAMLWAQCWRKRPLTLLHAASTSETFPMSGDQDWQSVHATFMPPKDTEFITVRCVLRGVGAAWFDNIALTVELAEKEEKKDGGATALSSNRPAESAAAATNTAEKPPSTANAEAEPKTPADLADAPEPRQSSPVVADIAEHEKAVSEGEETAEKKAEDPAAYLNAIEQDMVRLREVNLLLMDALESMEGRNDELMRQVKALQEDLGQLRKESAVKQTAPTELTPVSPSIPNIPGIPPLVPHGGDWRSILKLLEQ